MMQSEIVIIGSGISALTAAAILAKHGIQVAVIEKKPRMGGAIKSFKRQNITFDVGFHYTGCLGEGEILNKIWSYCNVLPDISIKPFPAHGSDRLYPKNYNGTIDAFFSYKLFQEELVYHFPKKRSAIETYFSTIKKICEKVPFYNMRLSVTDFLRGYKSNGIPLSGYLRDLTSNSTLQSVFAAPALLYGVPTDNVSLDVHAMVAHGYYQGAYTVSGGGQSIVNGFKKSCKDFGVTFITSEEVTKIEYDKNGITAVGSNSGLKIACKKVIFTGHPSLLLNIIDNKAFRPAYCNRLASLKNTVSMNILFGALPTPSDLPDWNNLIFLPDGPNPFDWSSPSTDDQLMMLTSTERESNSLQQKNKSVILLQPAHWQEVKNFMQPTSKSRPAEYLLYKEKLHNTMMLQAGQYWPEIVKNIRTLAIGTPLTIHDELSAPQGCSYGAMHSLDQYTPDIRTKLPGLYLSGQSTLMTGLVGASIAGMISAGEILGLEPLWEAIRQWK